LRPLVITSAKRSPLLPNVPTLDELGIKDAGVTSWQALAAPRGLPADVKAKIHAATLATFNEASTKAKLLELGFEMVLNTPEQFAAFQAAEYSKWQKLITSRNIKAD
jgi:tripartite-type tricarboxylate transporter receptor subunit TctC